MIDLTLIGYIGGILLAICGAPQAYLSYKQGHSDGISILFLLMWSLGEIFTLIYIIPKIDIPLLLNYTSNLVFLLIIWRYKIFRRNK
jgi:uncharacterized protein with PQ loop repeat